MKTLVPKTAEYMLSETGIDCPAELRGPMVGSARWRGRVWSCSNTPVGAQLLGSPDLHNPALGMKQQQDLANMSKSPRNPRRVGIGMPLVMGCML